MARGEARSHVMREGACVHCAMRADWPGARHACAAPITVSSLASARAFAKRVRSMWSAGDSASTVALKLDVSKKLVDQILTRSRRR